MYSSRVLDSMEESTLVETVDPEEVYSILSDVNRIGILRALWEADGHQASFSELRAAVGMRDSGKFNYHLGKLTSRFVRKTADGYELRTAGMHVIGAILAGGYTVSGSIEPIPIDDPCPQCSSRLWFTYEDERVAVDCEECFFSTTFPVPPGAFIGYELGELPEASMRYLRSKVCKLLAGFCSLCEGSMEISITSLGTYSEEPVPVELEGYPVVRFECNRCESTHQLGLNAVLLEHPAVISFYYDHGIDVRRVPIWHGDMLVFNEHEDTFGVHQEPASGTVTFHTEDEYLRLTVDESLEVIEVDKSSR